MDRAFEYGALRIRGLSAMKGIYNNFLGYIRISYHKLLWVFLFAVLLYCLFHMLKKASGKRDVLCRVVLCVAVSFIFVMTLFSRSAGDYTVTLRPFWSYRTAYETENAELWLQIIMNIAMYVPIGFALPGCLQTVDKLWKVIVLVLICSVGIEAIQYIFSIGYAEVDDVINNLFGTLIGYALYMGFEKCCKKLTKE